MFGAKPSGTGIFGFGAKKEESKPTGFSFGASAPSSGFSFGVSSGGDQPGKTDYSHLGFGAKEESDGNDSDDLFGENSEAESESDSDCDEIESADLEEDVGEKLFIKVSGNLPDDELVRKAKELGLPANFYNYLETPEVAENEKFPWEESDSSAPPKITQVEVTKSEAPKSGFSFNFGGTGGSPKTSFGAVAGQSNGFGGGFSSTGFAGFKNAGKPLFGAQEQNGEENENAQEEECNAQFKPVLDELPPEVKG